MSDYDWRYENSINWNKDYIDVESVDGHPYNSWRTNATLANYVDTVLYSNQMNISSHLDKKLQYDYLFFSIRKRKRFFKRNKVEKKDKLLLIQSYYKYNIKRAKEIVDLLSDEDIELIKKKTNKGD